MSNYLGFEPCDNPNYFFVSYNNEDAERVGEIAQRLHHSNVPLWYDHGIDYGETWETKISEKLMNAQAVILFFTKGILFKEHSYVQKEYIMATEYFEKAVYVVIMDNINNKEIPHNKVPWLIDIQAKQCIHVSNETNMDVIVQEISKAIGMASHKDKMNQMIKNYKLLYDSGKTNEAELYLTDYMNGMSLAGKAKCIADIFSGKIKEVSLPVTSIEIKSKINPPLISHIGKPVDSFYECQKLTIKQTVFTIGNSFVFHRGCMGDAYVINIWKNDQNIFTVGGLVEAYNMRIYYDIVDDIVYIAYSSEQENRANGINESKTYISIITIERPTEDAICNDFKWLVEL